MNLLPNNVSTYGGDVDFVFWLITSLVGFWFFVTLFAIIYFAIRYRASKNPKAAYIKGESWKEEKFIEVPHLIVLACDVAIIAYTFTAWNRIEIDVPAADYEVGVEGKTWSWVFRYPGIDGKLNTPDDVVVDESTNGVLHVPVNKNIIVHISSQETLHSFFVKELRLKQDAIPGRVITKWFNAHKEGKYEIACAEICGYGHFQMRNYLVVESEDNFQKYTAELYAKNASSNVVMAAKKGENK